MKYEAKMIDGKMMLVSRDIKVGDKLYYPDGPVAEIGKI